MQNYGKMKVQLNRLEFGQSNCSERVQGGGAPGDNCQLVDQPAASLLPTRIRSLALSLVWLDNLLVVGPSQHTWPALCVCLHSSLVTHHPIPSPGQSSLLQPSTSS